MKKFGVILLIFTTLFITFMPINVRAEEETLADYKRLLDKFKKDYADTQASINKTEGEIKNTNKQIANIKQEMIDMAAEVGVLKEDIASYKEQIEEKKLQTKKLVEYLQLSSGENLYLEYAFGADTMTDLIYRMSVVEQITDYNEQVIDDLNDLIKKSEARQVEINEKEKQLTNKQAELEKLLVSLGEDVSTLSESGVSYSKQIKLYEEEIEMYKKLGCKDNDVIGVDCAVTSSLGSWRRPTKAGYVTSEYGMRTLNGKTSLHRGVDISNSNPYQTKIYAAANGTVSKKYKDDYGALCLIIEHYDSKAKKYYSSTYCHLSSYNSAIKVGSNVTSGTWLGYMGATGYVTGPHLHFEITPCRKYNGADKNCSTWSKYISYSTKLYNQGFKGPRQFISFPSGLYNRWSSR